MRIVDAALARLLPPLSALLRRPLAVVVGHALEKNDSPSVLVVTPGVGVRSDDGQPFSALEREVLERVFEAIRMADDRNSRVQALEDRIISLQRDNLELIVKNQILSEVSARDALTGLYNRPYVLEKIESELNRALRHGSPISLLMLDIDFFKRINDEYGHPAGDEVLKGIGRVLRESCRTSSTMINPPTPALRRKWHSETSMGRALVREMRTEMSAMRSEVGATFSPHSHCTTSSARSSPSSPPR